MLGRVIILGGGIAGLSAAHELAERGFAVEVFEKKTIPGGKARSIAVRRPDGYAQGRRLQPPAAPASGHARKPWLPGEHGFRFFPRFYRHVVDTMSRIPYRGGSVADNLVDTTRVQLLRFDREPISMPARFPRTPGDLQTALNTVLALLGGELGIPGEETMFFASKVWQILTSCEERRFVEYEKIDWWRFVEADARSEGYRQLYANGITRSLVAAKARKASTKTIGDIFTQLLLDVLQPGISSDRVLNGPTNDVWIDPWLEYLRGRGVVYHIDSDVRGIHCEGGRIRSATVVRNGRPSEVEGDYYIAALPIERMPQLLTPALRAADPSLACFEELNQCVEWMNGIQYYLTEDVPLVHGHTIYLDSPWALTSISQRQFWREVDLGDYGDGQVRGIISVDISDWNTKGLNGKEADDCTRGEIRLEVWEQMKRSVNVGGRTVLRDEQLHSWYLDPDIAPSDPSIPALETNAEPLLVNYVDTWRIRPEAVTRVPNLFLASDYVRTYTDLATMEAANEAARRAVNGVLAAAGSTQAPCGVWNLHEPEVLLPFRAYDRLRWRQGLPWDGAAMALVAAGLGFVHQARALLAP
jgi:uncharacterized protein with NAD-binding domain and iron-sulfur cluster